MRLEVEGRRPIDNPTEKQARTAIGLLRSYGPSSFASITDEYGSFLQVAGGRVTCMLERKDSRNGHYQRAYKMEKNDIFADGTILSFGGGQIKMQSDEWLTSVDVEAAFICFLNSEPMPPYLMWRDVSHIFQ